MNVVTKLINNMIDYYQNDTRRINHFLKVYSYANIIAENEKVDQKIKEIIEISSILHDIGIKKSEEKYNSSAGHYQEIEGPPIAKNMMKKHNISEEIIERVCFLIGNHHTYTRIDGMDYQILIEADFIVNIDSEKMNKSQIKNIKEKIFKTNHGIKLLDLLFNSSLDYGA